MRASETSSRYQTGGTLGMPAPKSRRRRRIACSLSKRTPKSWESAVCETLLGGFGSCISSSKMLGVMR